MTHIEAIKRKQYLEYFVEFSFGGVAGKLRDLPSDQRHLLARQTTAFREYLRTKGRHRANDALVDLVCFASLEVPSRDRGDEGGPKTRELTPQEMERALFWLDAVTKQLNAYQGLPHEERGILVRYAKALGVDLPLAPDNHPLQFLAALWRASDIHRQRTGQGSAELVESYRLLSPGEGHRLARDLISFWKRQPDLYRHQNEPTGLVEDTLLRLACLVPGSLRGLHVELIKAGMYYPGEVYRDADAPARDQLFRLLEQPPHNQETLFPLAWVGDGVVRDRFHRWRRSPPAWRPDITTTFAGIAASAGWEPTRSGGQRRLYHSECYQLVPSKDQARAPGSIPVAVVAAHEQSCGWCGRPLTTLFDINLKNARLRFLAPGWGRLRIAICGRCTCYGTVYTDVDANGGSRWSALNSRPGYIGTDKHGYQYPPGRLVLGPRRRSPFEAHQFVLTEGASQIGGFPMWVQGNSHPDCPKCQRLMVFLGQIETSEALGETAEGVTYAFLCQECGIAATTYEQT